MYVSTWKCAHDSPIFRHFVFPIKLSIVERVKSDNPGYVERDNED